MRLEPVTPLDYKRLQPFFSAQPYRLCAYALPSILVWQNKECRPHAGVFRDHLVVGVDFTVSRQHRHLIVPIGPNNGAFPPEVLQDVALELGFEAYGFVPQAYLDQHGRRQVEDYFEVIEQPTLADYIYRTEDLARLKGNRFCKKRNLINQFTRRYVDRGAVALEALTPAAAGECAAFLERWCRQRAFEAPQDVYLACEQQAILNTLAHLEQLEVKGLLLRLGGEVCAFGIAAHLTRGMGLLLFEKAQSDIKGLYQYFDCECARRLFHGYRYINKESDMGLAGLRQSKRSYHPVRIEKAYRLIVR